MTKNIALSWRTTIIGGILIAYGCFQKDAAVIATGAGLVVARDA